MSANQERCLECGSMARLYKAVDTLCPWHRAACDGCGRWGVGQYPQDAWSSFNAKAAKPKPVIQPLLVGAITKKTETGTLTYGVFAVATEKSKGYYDIEMIHYLRGGLYCNVPEKHCETCRNTCQSKDTVFYYKCPH